MNVYRFPPAGAAQTSLLSLEHIRQAKCIMGIYNRTAVLANSGENYINLMGQVIKHPSFPSD